MSNDKTVEESVRIICRNLFAQAITLRQAEEDLMCLINAERRSADAAEKQTESLRAIGNERYDQVKALQSCIQAAEKKLHTQDELIGKCREALQNTRATLMLCESKINQIPFSAQYVLTSARLVKEALNELDKVMGESK